MQAWSSDDREMALKAAVVDALDDVDRAMHAKNYPRALSLLLRLHSALPRNSSIANNLGYVFVALGDKDRALEAYRKANDLGPANPIPAVNVGQLLLERGQIDEAARRLAPWTNKVTTHPAVGLVLVQLAVQRGRNVEARMYSSAIVRSHHATMEQVFTASGLLRDLGDEAGSADGYRRVIHMDAGVGGAWSNLSDVLRTSGRLEEAEKITEETVRRFPQAGASYFQRGLVRQQRGRLEEAARDFERAAELKEDLADGLLRAAACYKKLGRLTEARALVDKFLAWPHPTFPHHREMAARLLHEITDAEGRPSGGAGVRGR